LVTNSVKSGDPELSQMLSEKNELTNAPALEQFCRKLINKAIEAGSTDNITVACCRKFA